MSYYIKALKQYFDFSSRACRKEYWMYVLFNVIFAIVAVIIDNVAGLAVKGLGYGPIYGIYMLAVLIPGWSISFRRLHDVGKSGWMFLIFLIPLIGAIWFLILLVKAGEAEDNKYGINPLVTK